MEEASEWNEAMLWLWLSLTYAMIQREQVKLNQIQNLAFFFPVRFSIPAQFLVICELRGRLNMVPSIRLLLTFSLTFLPCQRQQQQNDVAGATYPECTYFFVQMQNRGIRNSNWIYFLCINRGTICNWLIMGVEAVALPLLAD